MYIRATVLQNQGWYWQNSTKGSEGSLAHFQVTVRRRRNIETAMVTSPSNAIKTFSTGLGEKCLWACSKFGAENGIAD